MAVDVKVIRVYLWRFSVLFAGICFRFAQKHPCVSGTLLAIFVLYVFFPLVFRLLIYSSPVVICAYAYRKNVIKTEHLEARVQKKYDQTNDVSKELDVVKKRYVKIDAKENDKESKKALIEKDSDVFGKAENDTKNIKESGKGENAEIEDDHLSKQNGESESDIFDRAEYEDDEETQEEDAQEDTQKAVEWTEQDERNLMDLGTSETERDKRLESLIQKRRARKLLSMQVRNVIDIIRHPPNQIAPLVIARSNGPLNLINTLSDTDDLHMPGSAPSVLLPSRSPFDLPYDPFEERPDLTGDSSFEQEFVTADQKDFCRHESFFLGGHSGTRPDGNNSLNSFMNAEEKRAERQRFSRFKNYTDRGSYETISPGASSGEHELKTCADLAVHDSRCEQRSSEQTLKTDSVTSKDNTNTENINTEKKENCDSRSLNDDHSGRLGVDENVEPDSFHSGKNTSDSQVESAKGDSNKNPSSEDLGSYLRKTLASSMQNTASKEAKENGHVQAPLYTSSKDLFNVHKRALHTPAHSIASDLVVEVSEGGSPPPTLSPPDEDSSHYDGDVERDLSSGSEDLSLHVYRMDEHGTRSLEGQESIPEVVELEEGVVDEYEHISPTSSDGNSSYENVVHHLNEKLNARSESNNVIMGTSEEPSNPAEIGSVVQIENLLSNQTNPMSGASAIAERNERNSASTDETNPGTSSSNKRENESVEEVGWPVEEQGSSNTQVSEDVHRNTEIRTSDDVTLNTSSDQQDQVTEEIPEVVTSPKSVLPDKEFRDQITRLDSQPSDLTGSASDAPPLENSTSNLSDSQRSQHAEIQDVRSLPSRSIIQPGSNDGLDQTINSEATLITATEASKNIEGTISKTTQDAEGNLVQSQGDYPVTRVDPFAECSNLELTKDEKEITLTKSEAEYSARLNSTEALPLSNHLNSDDEFNGLSKESHVLNLKGGTSSTPEALGGIQDDTTQSEALMSDMDTELHIHRITETCM